MLAYRPQEVGEAVKPRGSYAKDDFFDALSCETLDRMTISERSACRKGNSGIGCARRGCLAKAPRGV
jgi:hypothetical protein